jgi:hypothetical protein
LITIKELLAANLLYVIGFLAFIVVGVILQVIMLRSGGNTKLPAWFNRLVGSLTYSLFFLIFLGISYIIFGTQVVDKIWFTIFGLLAFPTTGLFLCIIGFWRYKN